MFTKARTLITFLPSWYS